MFWWLGTESDDSHDEWTNETQMSPRYEQLTVGFGWFQRSGFALTHISDGEIRSGSLRTFHSLTRGCGIRLISFVFWWSQHRHETKRFSTPKTCTRKPCEPESIWSCSMQRIHSMQMNAPNWTRPNTRGVQKNFLVKLTGVWEVSLSLDLSRYCVVVLLSHQGAARRKVSGGRSKRKWLLFDAEPSPCGIVGSASSASPRPTIARNQVRQLHTIESWGRKTLTVTDSWGFKRLAPQHQTQTH